MPPKRPRESSTYPDNVHVKRQRSQPDPQDFDTLEQNTPWGFFSTLRSKLGFGGTMGNYNDGRAKSRSQMRAATFKSLPARRLNGEIRDINLPNGAGRISETPEPGGVLEAIRSKDRQLALYKSKGGLDGLQNGISSESTPVEAGPSHSRTQSPALHEYNEQLPNQSPASRLIGAARSLLFAPNPSLASSSNDRLFDEGSLRPDLGMSASQPIELDDSSDSDNEAGPSSLSSNIAPISPALSSPLFPHTRGRPPPSRPRLGNYQPPPRSYEWLDPDSESSSSTSSHAYTFPSKPLTRRERRIHTSHLRKRSSNLRRSSAADEDRRRKVVQALRKSTGGGSQEVQEAGKRTMRYFEESLGREAEKTLRAQTQEGKPTKAVFESLLRSLAKSGEKSLDNILKKQSSSTEFSIEKHRKRADKAKEDVHSKPTSAIDDLVDKYKKQQIKDEALVQARLRPSVPTTMARRRLQTVQQHLSNRSFDARCSNQTVKIDSLKRLTGSSWLDDEIINFYGAMILSRSQKAQQDGGDKSVPDVYFLNSFFYQKLSENGYETARLARWTKRAKVDIFSKDVVVFPINLGQMHWVTGAINMKKKRLEFYDSMGDKTNIRKKVFENLWDYLEKEHKDKKGKAFDPAGWEESFANDTPQQDNGSDCGVFTCQTLEALSRGIDLTQPEAKGFEFSAKNMPYIRQLMILEIGQAALETRWPKEE